MNKLTIFHQSRPLGEIELKSQSVSIGRSADNTVQIKQASVSLWHARVSQENGQWVLEDLNSTNGTRVNEADVQHSVLHDGDIIGIGEYKIHFSASAAAQYLNSEYTIDAARHFQWGKADAGNESYTRAYEPEQTNAERLWQILYTIFPILVWAPRYRKDYLHGDLSAGVTVAIMLVPQGMAYALLAGLPPIYGLYASVAPPFVYALMGTSRQLSAGPAALDSLLVATGVTALGHFGEGRFIELAILLAMMVGSIQILLGIARLGFVVNFLSYPVMTGFTSAAALIIAFSQLKHMLGIDLPQTHEIHIIISAVVQRATQINGFTLVIGLISIVIIIGLKRIKSRIPGALTAVVVCTVAVWLFKLDAEGVAIVQTVPVGLPLPSLPHINTDDLKALMPLALTIALIGFMQSISVAKIFAAKNNYRVYANQEMIAIGCANFAGSLFKGFPISGGLSRSAVNASSGSQTGLASMITCLLIALTLFILTPLFYYLPKAVLAAIIMVAAWSLIDFKEITYLFKVKKSEGALLVLTILATLTIGISYGLFIGIVASILLYVSMNTRPNMAQLGRLPGTDTFRNIDNFPEAQCIDGLLILRIDASFYFANAEFLKEKLSQIAEQKNPPEAVILDATSINDLDSSADRTLHDIVDDFKRRAIVLYVAGVKAPVRDVMKNSGLYETIGAEFFFYTVNAAVQRFEQTKTPTRHHVA